ncbi:MAG: hypothetical protein K2Y26_09435 [Gemmatimonadaceae bacterium]|nr:hypothetical protein [Gemmatimonadaceae bacterium]MBX9855739.1 hypothetical protein [Gemmatimonadaceae bacterium]
MYSTCLFCTDPLGRNDVIEHFPVGRRLAFDAARGRLWVVCPSCARWNLSPLDIRWEAIEEMERRYRDTRTRVATEHIGMAQLPDRTRLIRIGQPLRPEFAAWRYGQVFKERRRRDHVWQTAALATLIASFGLGHAVPGLVGGMALYNGVQIVSAGRFLLQRHRPRVPVRLDSGRTVRLSAASAALARFRRDVEGQWYLRLHHADYQSTGPLLRALGVSHRRLAVSTYSDVHGPEIFRYAANMLPLVNSTGAQEDTIAEAVECVANLANAQSILERVARSHRGDPDNLTIFSEMPAVERLALEMALHEDDERRALEGELAELETRWREAEELAAIADNLVVPAAVTERLASLQSDKPSQPPGAAAD